MHCACAEFRVKLSRDTGVNLPAATCEVLLNTIFNGQGGEPDVSLQSNPGRFYEALGGVIADQTIPLVLPDHLKVAWYCYREAAEVHNNTSTRGARPDLPSATTTVRELLRTPRRLLFGTRRLRTWETPPPKPTSAVS